MKKLRLKYWGLEEKMKNKEEELPDAHDDLLRLRDEQIGLSMPTWRQEEFVHVMQAHDDTIFPTILRTRSSSRYNISLTPRL